MGFYCSYFIRKSETTDLVLEFLHALQYAAGYDYDLIHARDTREFPDHVTVWRLNQELDGFVNKFLVAFNATDHLNEILESVHRVEPPNNAPTRYEEAAGDELRLDDGYIKSTQDWWSNALLIFALIAWATGKEIVIRTHDEGGGGVEAGNYYSIVPPEHALNLDSHEALLYYLEDRKCCFDPYYPWSDVPPTFDDKCFMFICSLIEDIA